MDTSSLMDGISEWLEQNGSAEMAQQKSQQSFVVDNAFIAEPVTQPFTLQSAEFLLSSSNILISIEEDNKSCQSWSSATSQQEIATINASKKCEKKVAVTRIRTWVTAATTQGPNH